MQLLTIFGLSASSGLLSSLLGVLSVVSLLQVAVTQQDNSTVSPAPNVTYETTTVNLTSPLPVNVTDITNTTSVASTVIPATSKWLGLGVNLT